MTDLYTLAYPTLVAFLGAGSAKLILGSATWKDLIGVPILVLILTLTFHNRIEGLQQEVIWGISGLLGYALPSLKKYINPLYIIYVIGKGKQKEQTRKEASVNIIIDDIEKDLNNNGEEGE